MFWGLTYIIELSALYFTMIVVGYSPKKKAYLFYVIVTVSFGFVYMFSTRENPEWMWIPDLLSVFAVPFGIEGRNKMLSTVLSYTAISLSFFQSLIMHVLVNSGLKLMNMNFVESESFFEFYMNKDYNVYFILNELLLLVAAIFVIVVINITKKKSIFDFRLIDFKLFGRKFLMLLQISLVVFALLTSIIQVFGSNSSYNTLIKRTSTLLLSGSTFIIAALISKSLIDNSEKNHYKELAGINETLVEKQRQYFDLLLNNEEATKKFRHDINNHFSCIRYLLENESYNEVKEYIEDVANSASELRPAVETGNIILNIVVGDLLNRFKDVGFKINWKGYFPTDIKISAADLCVIFSNALTNAIEAVEKLNSSKIETIEVDIKYVGNNLFLSIQNPCAGPAYIRGGFLLTDKPDKATHGFGTQNIAERVEKYGGEVKFSNHTSSFLVEMIFYEAMVG